MTQTRKTVFLREVTQTDSHGTPPRCPMARPPSWDPLATWNTAAPSSTPVPDEIVMFLAYADRGRPIPRSGKGPAKT